MSPEKDEQTFENIKMLERVSQMKPLSNPKIFGYYDVAYTKAGSRQDGAPAGGAPGAHWGRRQLFGETHLLSTGGAPGALAAVAPGRPR